MDVGTLFHTIAPGFTGGITGVIGAFVSGLTKYKMLKLQYEHEENLKKLDMESKKLETDLQLKLAQANINAETIKSNYEVLKKSYEILNQPLFKESYFDKLPSWLQTLIGFLDAIIDAVRASIRPMLTIWLTIVSSWICFSIFQTNPKQFLLSTNDVIATILFLTTAVVMWWFGNKDIENHINKILDNRFNSNKLK
jgi:hypothetical protein